MQPPTLQPASPPSLSAPRGWPRVSTPLRIALIGWARLSNQGLEGSGYNLSASELARGLALSGHTVSYLASGMTYYLFGGPRIKFRERWGSVDCFELINSPNLAPSAHNFRNVVAETACPRESRLVVRWLEKIRAQVVHIHSLEGYGVDLIGAIRDSGRPAVVTPHNYWFVCPQVDLLHEEARVCLDYDGGRQCVGCLKAQKPSRLKLKRAAGDTLERWLGPFRADVVRKAAYGVGPTVRAVVSGSALRPWRQPLLNPDSLDDPELAAGFSPSPGEGTAHGGATEGGLSRARIVGVAGTGSAADTNERLLGGEHHLTVLNDYGRRRHAGVDALNRASLVIPPSDFLRRVHVSMGVDDHRTRWVRLGQPHFDRINRRARRSPFYSARPWDPATARRPLRLAFFGTTRPNKGLDVLVGAIPHIPPEMRRRCQIIVRALGDDRAVRARLAEFPEVSVSGGYDLTQLVAAAGEYDAGILPHIWLENSPLVMLEHLHAGKFVVSSRLGGPVDWIDEPRNGLLFPAGDSGALAGCISRLISGDVPLPSPREVHEVTLLQSYPAHVREVESVYYEVLSRPEPVRREPAADQGQPATGPMDAKPQSNGHAGAPPPVVTTIGSRPRV